MVNLAKRSVIMCGGDDVALNSIMLSSRRWHTVRRLNAHRREYLNTTPRAEHRFTVAL